MKFDKTPIIHDCNCLENANEDSHNHFLRRVYSNTPNDTDFHTYAELGKIPKDNCKDKCSYNGVSINLTTELTYQLIIKKYKENIQARKKINAQISIPEYCFRFKMRETAGKIIQSGNEVTHFTFYKADDFTVDNSIENLEVTHLL